MVYFYSLLKTIQLYEKENCPNFAKIKSAKGKKGFILYNPITKTNFFRIYHADKSFTDYDLATYDLEVEIVDNRHELYEYEDDRSNRLDYSRRTRTPSPNATLTTINRKTL